MQDLKDFLVCGNTKIDFALLKEKMRGFMGEINDVRNMRVCKFKLGHVENGADPDLDDSQWQEWKGELWDPSKEEAWFRCRIKIPEEVCGVSLKGSNVKALLFTPNGGDVFIDGKKVVTTDWLPDVFIPVADKIRKDQEVVMAFRLNKGPGWGRFFFCNILAEKLEDKIFQFEMFMNLSTLARTLTKSKKADYGSLLEKAMSVIDGDAITRKDFNAVMFSFEKALKILKPLSKEIKKLKIHLAGHAHIDMNWLWTWPRTLNTAWGTFKTVDKLMDENPDLCFSQSQAGLYEGVEENLPQIFNIIKKRVKQGRWDVTASTWVEGDLNTADGEALVRQTLYAKKYIKEKFGLEPRVCWCPDTFGHPWTYPQILKKSGIDFYFSARCRPSEDCPVFWWESPDGSRILAFISGDGYAQKISPSIANGLSKVLQSTGLSHHLAVFGMGDHGGGPSRMDIGNLRKLQGVEQFPTVRFNSVHNYFKTITDEIKAKKINLAVVNNGLNFLYEGCYSSHGDVKMYNRKSESILPAAETVSVIAETVCSGEYPAARIEKAWKNALFSQFHDILCGCAIHDSYGDGDHHAKEMFKEIIGIAEGEIGASMKGLSSAIEFKGSGAPVVVFNPSSWERKDIVEVLGCQSVNVSKLKDAKEIYMLDNEGRCVPSQISGENVIFAANVPPTGYRTYYINKVASVQCPVSSSQAELKITEEDEKMITVENKFFTVKIQKESGCIQNLIDKRADTDIIAPFKHGGEAPIFSVPGNLLQIHYERPHAMSAWVMGPISRVDNLLSGAKVEIKENGPVRIVIGVERQVLNSFLKQDIVIYSDIPRIDFHTEVDWKENGTPEKDAPMLKVAFPLSFTEARMHYEIPFGYNSHFVNGDELPALRWMDVSSSGRGKKGLSVLNDCKYGCDVQGNVMRLTLLRSSYEPDPIADIGNHKFAYSIYPHAGDWRTAGTVRRGYEFNQPLLVYPSNVERRTSDDGPRTMDHGRRSLPESRSFLSVEPSNIIVTAFKKAEDGKGIILRFYEAHGKSTKAVVNLNMSVTDAAETDLTERVLPGKKLKVSKGRININVGKHEIKTLRLKIKK